MSLLDSMPRAQVTPDEISLNAAISACGKCGKVEQAVSLFNSIATTTEA